MTTASPPNQQENHNSSHDDPVRDKLRALPHLMRGVNVRHVITIVIFSIILYHICEACIYVVQDRVEEIL